ncbi:WD40 repeat-like protein [Lentinus tigrinus ALCF2SS1-7]|uniref:WD40 repeat-like protein n=1 Tax=Lentinus tigrinus ALCF2SS1-6 TaxID=1328759 RepID=A0A5C2SU47_9APHY|nr:WD40 repeat-like protein [Lentinus tigrinus ALCF2SS1-6]RPD81334.1 WD40 repeat-like protein [Lentinus tigrinus ALCF2SS1-7]
MPIVPPPTPAPSPPPGQLSFHNGDPTILSHASAFATLSPAARRQHLHALIQECTPSELLFLSTTIAPLLKRDFLRALPPEVSLHILNFIDDPRTLARAARVSRYWNELLKDDCLWKAMCVRHGFSRDVDAVESYRREQGLDGRRRSSLSLSGARLPDADRDGARMPVGLQPARAEIDNFPYRRFFIYEHLRMSNWLQQGRLLRIHRAPLHPPVSQDLNAPNAAQAPVANPAIPTSIAIDSSWVVVGLANSRIHIFSARTGVLSRTLVGHESGVWAVSLITEGGRPAPPGVPVSDNYGDPLVATAPQDAMLPALLRYALGLEPPARANGVAPDPFAEGKAAEPPPFGKPSYPGGASDGWGQPNALVVSGGCDKELRVWDVRSGYCIYVLRGHTSTIRCLKVLHGRPIAVSGSRDRTLRVWDIQRGRLLRILEGHTQSVRCLDACGNRVVSGSYDCTCRVWDVDTGACLHVLRGHFHQIYTVAFDGVRIASGGLDTTVRVWDASTGACLALLQGHTALVCQLQLTPTMLATGGSDGRVITFSLKDATFSVVQRLAAHDSSVSGLQLDERFLVTSGNDGRVRLYEFELASAPSPFEPQCRFVRDMCEPSESVWKVAYTRETCAILSKKAGKMVVEIWSFKPEQE